MRKIDINAKVITTEEFLSSIEERNAKKSKVKKIVAKPPPKSETKEKGIGYRLILMKLMTTLLGFQVEIVWMISKLN